MKKGLCIFLCVVVCLGFLMSGCASQGDAQPKAVKTKSAPEVIGGGLANTGLVLYDMGAMTVNMVWAIGTFGYGFVDGQTLLPVYNFDNGKFEPHRY